MNNFNYILNDCKNGNTKKLKCFLKNPYSNPSVDNNILIRTAVMNNRINVVKLLLNNKKLEYSSGIDIALGFSIMNNNNEIEEMLIKFKQRKIFEENVFICFLIILIIISILIIMNIPINN